jgi:hypothetical protein
MVWQETAISVFTAWRRTLGALCNVLWRNIDFRELMPWSLADVYATLFYVHLPRFLGLFVLFLLFVNM